MRSIAVIISKHRTCERNQLWFYMLLPTTLLNNFKYLRGMYHNVTHVITPTPHPSPLTPSSPHSPPLTPSPISRGRIGSLVYYTFSLSYIQYFWIECNTYGENAFHGCRIYPFQIMYIMLCVRWSVCIPFCDRQAENVNYCTGVNPTW